jgi:hypothetical protein
MSEETKPVDFVGLKGFARENKGLLNSLKYHGNCMYHILQQSVTAFCPQDIFKGFV